MTDERDPKVSQRYREFGAEEPPRALDDAILAAARNAVEQDARPHAPLVTPVGRHRWYYGLGAAAVIVLAVSVTLQVERQQPDDSYAPPAEAPKTDSAPPATPSAAEPPAAEPPAREPPRSREKQAAAPKPQPRFTPEPPPPAAAPAPQPEPARAPEVASSRAADAMMEGRARAETSASAGAAADAAPPAAARPAPAPMAKPKPAPPVAMQRAPASRPMERAAVETPEQQLERIAELRREERHEEADKALEEFRKRYPDYKISGPMLDRVERR